MVWGLWASGYTYMALLGNSSTSSQTLFP